MKRLIRGFIAALLTTCLAPGFSACSDDKEDYASKTIIGSFDPKTDLAGSVKVLEGESVTVYGRNLDQVSSVLVGQTDKPAVITSQTESQFSFVVPMLDELLTDDPQAVRLKIIAGENQLVFNNNYYITSSGLGFRVASASTSVVNATVGDVVTIDGRAMEEVTHILLINPVSEQEITVESTVFLTHTAEQITFPILPGTYLPGRNKMDVTVYTATTSRTPETQITVTLPKHDQMLTQNQPALIGSSFTLTGSCLEVIHSVYWGEWELIIDRKTDGEVSVRFPARITEQKPVIASANLTAYYGTPAQTVNLYTDYRLDTTPQAEEIPAASAITSSTSDGRFFLNSRGIITGQYLQYVSEIKVDGLVAKIVDQNNTSLTFDMPEDFTFLTAKEVKVEAKYNTDYLDFGEIKAHPFYYFQGLQLGVHSNGAGAAHADASNNAVAVLSTGLVHDTREVYKEDPPYFDPFVWNGKKVELGDVAQGAMDADGKINPLAVTSKEDYYSVAPYIFIAAGSNGRPNITSAATGSASNYRYLRIMNNETSFSQRITNNAWGTPIVTFRVMGAPNDQVWAEAVRNKTLATVLDYDGAQATSGDLAVAYTNNSVGAPAPTEGTGGSGWVKGSVILMQYLTYEFGMSETTPSNHTWEDVYQNGFMHITDITCLSEGGFTWDQYAGSPSGTRRSGLITFDVYWPKQALQP